MTTERGPWAADQAEVTFTLSSKLHTHKDLLVS